jgi:hypothetical protein
MKIRTVPATKLTFLCAALVGVLLMFADKASAVSIRDAQERNLINNDRSNYADHLISMHNDINQTPQAVLADPMNSGNAGNVREVITIPRQALPRLGGVPSPGTTRVPDGGITAMLLGTALGALGIARRYIRK